jgi:small subunit ribosomal protein S36
MRHALRSVPRLVWLVTALHVSLMAAYALLYLPYTNPDEAQHHDMVVAWLHGDGLTAPGERFLTAGVGDGHDFAFGVFQAPPFTDHDVPPRGERPTAEALGGNRRATNHTLPNQMTQHPPLYYSLLAGIVYVVPGDSGWAWDQGVGFLRMINVLLLAPIPVLAWAAVRPLTRSTVSPIAAAMVPLLIPGLSRVGGTINNDNLLTLLAGILTVLLVHVCLGNLRLRMAIAVGTVTGLALLTKGWALAFPLIVAFAYLVGWRRTRGSLPWKPALSAQLVAFAVGGWWWVANWVRFGEVRPNGYGQEGWEQLRGPKAPDSLPRDTVEFLRGFAERLGQRSVAWLGRLEPPLFPFRLALVVMVIMALGVVFAFVLRRRAEISLGVAALGVLPTIAILSMMMITSYDSWKDYLIFMGAQGRYLYPGIVGLALVVAVGFSAALSHSRRWLLLGILALAGIIQYVAANIIADTFWSPRGSGGLRVDRIDNVLAAVGRWAPWPVGLTALPFLGILVFGVATAADALRLGLTGDRVPTDHEFQAGSLETPESGIPPGPEDADTAPVQTAGREREASPASP